MKLSFDWLCDYVDLSGLSPQEVADKLTMGAFEVEEVTPVRPEITGPVVVGEILEIYPHPNANKIRLTKTRVAPGAEPLEIVCGAQNIEVGQRIPVALDGALVVNRLDGTPLKIEARDVRGVVSNGMLCSTPELGLPATDIDGIFVLPHSDATPFELGINIIELLHLRQDWILHVEPRSNRGDALSVVGMAREVAALMKRPLKQPQWSLPAESLKEGELEFAVNIENAEDCPFFSVRTIADLKPGRSPAFIQRRLEAIGMRCVNNIVDITNYVMHEYGQPLHAYDYSFIKGHVLNVRRAKQDELITTLDAKERKLTSEVLMITDGQGPVGVAGVMGGKDSEIGDTTQNIALEAASFQPARVRRGSRLLGLSSDSSLRFERGVDVAGVAKASDRATYLMLEYCGGKQTKPRMGKLVAAGDSAVKPVHVTCRMKALKRVLGAEFTPGQVKELLTPLGFAVENGSDTEAKVGVPSFRQNDVTREIDIVEEVCRLWGYDNLPISMPVSNVAPDRPDNTLDVVRDALSGLGLSEAWLSSLTSSDDVSYGLQEENHAVRVLNPLSADHQVLRQSLLPGLIKAASYNYDHGQQNVWLFEVGRVYLHLGAETRDHDRFKSGTGVLEEHHAGGILLGRNTSSEWRDHGKKETLNELDFYQAKGIVENLLKRLRIDLQSVQYLVPAEVPNCMHPSRTCQVVYDTSKNPSKPELLTIGWIAELHPAMRDSLRFKQPAYLFELNVDLIRDKIAKSKFKAIPSTPTVCRDLTVDVHDNIYQSAVQSCISRAAGRTLSAVGLVSSYQPAAGQKSLSFRLTFQSAEKTLTNDEVDSSLVKVRKQLKDNLGASFRED